MSGGPFKPSVGLSGINSCRPHANGTQEVPAIRADSLCNLLLLPSPRVVHRCIFKASIRNRTRTDLKELPTVRLRICCHAGARSSADQRTATSDSGRCDQVPEARCVTEIDRRLTAFLARAIL